MTISLEKEYAMEWWKNIAEGEPEIDTAKVAPTTPTQPTACNVTSSGLLVHPSIRLACFLARHLISVRGLAGGTGKLQVVGP